MNIRSRSLLVAALAAGLLLSCRTTRPVGDPIAPLRAATAEEAMTQLVARRAAFREVRSLMRVRTTAEGKTQSFRAQLAVHDRNRMELTAYTPVGTTALVLKAEGDRVSIDNRMNDTAWEGSASDLARTLGFLGTSLDPAETAMLILGIPPRDDLRYEVDAAGLRSAATDDLMVTFEPPAFPAQRVVIVRGDNRVEIEHLEVVQ